MKKCIGFGEAKGKCKDPVGSKWDSPYFCQNCDEKRMEHIDKGMKAIADKFGIPFEPSIFRTQGDTNK